MTTLDRLCLFLTAALVGTALIFATDKPSNSEKLYPDTMCDDIAHELNNAYTEGLITESEARHIIESCYHLYP